MTGAQAQPTYALRGIGKSFGPVFACQGIDLEVFPGDVIALAGENGAGKSTTMRCLFGSFAPTEGHIEVDGSAVGFRSPRDAEGHGIAMIPQELDLFPELSIVENLFIGQDRPRNRLGLFDKGAMRRRAREVMSSLGVDVDVEAPVRTISVAIGKLVEIGRALNRDARLIIMDEPTAALTARETERLFAVIARLKAAKVSIIYITHRLDEIFAISNRVVVMRDGGLVRSSATNDMTVESLVDAMVGRPLEALYQRHPHPAGKVALAVRALTRANAFKNITFEVREGEVLGVSGLIGSGRSEVAQAIYGIAPPDSGEIVLDGTAVRIRSPAAAMANGIAYLPEERRSQGLILQLSIGGNISFAALSKFTSLGFVDRKREEAFAAQSCKRLTVSGASISAPVEVLSGGNQQKVLLAKTLALDPRIIILDEPTRGVDVGAKSEIYAIIDRLAAQGKAVILISSEMNEVLSMSDRIIVMHEGAISGVFARSQFSQTAIGAAAAGRPAVRHVA